MKRWQNLKRFLNENFIWSTDVVLAYNVLQIGDVAEFGTQNYLQALNLN
jgi:hypothetical protein